MIYTQIFQRCIDFRRCNQTSIDVRFRRLQSIPALKKNKQLQWPYTHNIGETERANWDIYDDFKVKKLFVLLGLYTNISALYQL